MDREPRMHKPRDVVVAFARQGVALDVIARSLVTSMSHIRSIVNKAFTTGELLAIPPETNVDRKSPLHAELTTLRETIERQAETIRELQHLGSGNNSDLAFKLTGVHKLTRTEARILTILADKGRATKERIYFALYGNKHGFDQPDPKIVDVFVCKARAKLPDDVKVDTLWGQGYEMKPASVARLKELAGIAAAPTAPSIVPTHAEMAA